MSEYKSSETYTENESYMHKYAKEVFKQWCDFKKDNVFSYFDKFYFKDTYHHCYLEYPIVRERNFDSIHYVWNEEKDTTPTYKECIENKLKPFYVVDLVISKNDNVHFSRDYFKLHNTDLYKIFPYYYIEICHKNPVSYEKIIGLVNLGVKKLVEMDAEWIMNQTKIPKELKYKKLIWEGKITLETESRKNDF